MAKREPSRTRRAVVDGWRLGGAAIGFVFGSESLKRFLRGSILIVLIISGGVGVAAVALRRDGGPVQYVLAGLGAFYCLSLLVTAIAVGAAAIVASDLDEQPSSALIGWRAIRQRRRTIAGWALVDLVIGVPSRIIGSWTVDQLVVLVLGFGWGLLSFFAIPTIALTGATTWETARRSLRLMRGRWGDAVYSTVYLWVRAAVVFGLPGAAAVAAGVLLIRSGAVITGGALFAAGVAALALACLLAQAARMVITVVLYRYADSGTVYPAFPAELLDRSVRGPSNTFRRLARRVEGSRLRRVRERALNALEGPQPEDRSPTK
jgi:hypothetical protein